MWPKETTLSTPDFFLYRGEGNQVVLGALRACWKIRALEHDGQTVFLVEIKPPIPSGSVPAGVSTTVVGLSQHGGAPLERLAPGETASARVWEVYDLGQGRYGLSVAPGIGRANVYKTRPAIDSRGGVMQAPVGAKAAMGSILRSLGADDGTKK